jgi:hypothetical protein
MLPLSPFLSMYIVCVLLAALERSDHTDRCYAVVLFVLFLSLDHMS